MNLVNKVETKGPKELYINIIDEYYNNGFNKVKAVRAFKGQDYNNSSALSLFHRAYEHPTAISYVKKKQSDLKKKSAIRNENILRELINWAYVDITDFITLSAEDIKELPPDVRRCIQSFKYNKRSYVNRAGHHVTDEQIVVKLIDKTKAIEMINKHIGFYQVDNEQKQAKVNIEKLSVDTLNALLVASEPTKPDNNTLDVTPDK